MTPNLPSNYATVNRISIVQRIGRSAAKVQRTCSVHSAVDMDDGLVVPLASPRDLGSWGDERTECRVLGRPLSSRRYKISPPRPSLDRLPACRAHAVPSIMCDAVLRPVPIKCCNTYSSVGLTSSRSSWPHPASSRPGLIRLLSSVTTACALNHENPAGRQSTSAKLDHQEPYENGLGGAAPGINVLCAWFLICESESIANSEHADQCPNLFNRGNIQ